MKNIFFITIAILFSIVLNAQKVNDIYFNYDELVGIQIESDSTLKVFYNLKGKQQSQKTDFIKTDSGIKLGKLKYNFNPNVKKLSAEPLDFDSGNLYLAKYRMFFYSDKNRKKMEKQDCYIVNNEIFFAPKGNVKGKLRKTIRNLQKTSVKTAQIDSKTTYNKFGIHCLGATEILGIPKK